MSELANHYQALLALDTGWNVRQVDFSLPEKKVEIAFDHVGGLLVCPECGVLAPRPISRPSGSGGIWTPSSFKPASPLASLVPRAKCYACNVMTIAVPWASKHSRSTLFFEAFAIDVLKACATCSEPRRFWDSLASHDSILERAVELGLERRQLEEVRRVGIDEKNFGAGHS